MKVRTTDVRSHRAPPGGRWTRPRRPGSGARHRRARRRRPPTARSRARPAHAVAARRPRRRPRRRPPRAPVAERARRCAGTAATPAVARTSGRRGPGRSTAHARRHVDEDRVRDEGVVEPHQGVAAVLGTDPSISAAAGARRRPPTEGSPARGEPDREGAGVPVVHQHAARRGARGGRRTGGLQLARPAGAGRRRRSGAKSSRSRLVDRRVAPDLLALGGQRREARSASWPAAPRVAEPAGPGQGGGSLGVERVQGRTSFSLGHRPTVVGAVALYVAPTWRRPARTITLVASSAATGGSLRHG